MLEPSANGDSVPDAPSTWRRTVWSLAVAETLVWAGLYYIFPALLPHWEMEFAWSKTELAVAFTSALLLSAAAAPLTGRLIDRGYGRAVLSISAVAGGLLLACSTLVNQLWQFYLVWCGIGICLAGCLYEPCFAYLVRLFGTDAKRAITVVTLVAGFAGTVSFPTTHLLSQWLGWRAAALCFAAAICCIAAPLMWLSGRGRQVTRTKKPARGSIVAVMRLPVFWLLALSFFLISFHHGALITHLLLLLGERGVMEHTAVLAASMIGPMQVVGRLVMLSLERKVSVVVVCGSTFVALIASASVLHIAGTSTTLILCFVLLQGAGYGVTSITRPVITVSFLGRENFGAISGFQAVAYVGGTAIAPTIAALLWEYGGYDLVLEVCMGAALAGLISFLIAARISARQAAA